MNRFVRQHSRFAWLTLLVLLADFIARGLNFALQQPGLAGTSTIEARAVASALLALNLNLAALLFAFAAAISGAGLLGRLSNSRKLLRAIGWHLVAAMLALAAIILRLAVSETSGTNDSEAAERNHPGALLAAGTGLAFWAMSILSGRRVARLRRAEPKVRTTESGRS
ncbi:MAG: hypothetical protein NXI24_22090 [bacterium]|nr:hypothetical protein [bacterium]